MKRTYPRVLYLFAMLLSVCMNPTTAYPAKTYSVGEMEGTISVLSKKNEIMTVGDTVKVHIDATLVVQGDRLSVFEPLTRRVAKQKNEGAHDQPLINVGEIVITGIRGQNVYGEITSAKREILNGSHVRTLHPNLAGSPELIRFMQRIAASKLKNPVEDTIHIGITETVNENGDVTRGTAEAARDFSVSICGREQFNCVHPKQIEATLSKYGVATSDSIGKYIRQALNLEAGVEVLITSRSKNGENPGAITLLAWDLRNEMKSKPHTIPDLVLDESEPVNRVEVLKKSIDVRHGYLRVRLNNSDFTGVRRVDYLQTINIEDIVYKRFISDISARFSESIAWKDISITLNDQRYIPHPDGSVFDGILLSKTYLLRVTATPVLAGDRTVALGDPIEQTFELEIHPDRAIQTEIILKTRGKKAILIVDSVPEI